jgi:hypothetical protein
MALAIENLARSVMGVHGQGPHVLFTVDSEVDQYQLRCHARRAEDPAPAQNVDMTGFCLQTGG